MILPLTPGLLVSMAIRYDHSFGILMGAFDSYTDLSEKQIMLLRAVMVYYRCGQELSNYATGTHAQLWEEMTGVGFYRPEKESAYQASAQPAALLEAVRIVKEHDDE
jgi:hypothetical protein